MTVWHSDEKEFSLFFGIVFDEKNCEHLVNF